MLFHALLGAALALPQPGLADVKAQAPVTTPSRVWIEIDVQEPDEQVEVRVPAEWVNEEVLSSELEEDLQEVDLEAAIAEMKKTPLGTREKIVTATSPDEDVQIYLAHRPIDATAQKAKRIRIDVHDNEDQVHINMRLPLARALMKTAVRFDDDMSKQDVVAVGKILDQMDDMEPFQMVHVTGNDHEEVWIRLE